MGRWALTAAVLGLLASGVSCALLMATDTSSPLAMAVKLIAVLIWPTGFLLLGNEAATTASEVIANFAKAIGGNMAIYAAAGAALYSLRTRRRGAAMRRNPHGV